MQPRHDTVTSLELCTLPGTSGILVSTTTLLAVLCASGHHCRNKSAPLSHGARDLSAQRPGCRFLPDKAIDLIDEAGSRVRLRHAALPEEAWGACHAPTREGLSGSG